MTTMRPQEFLGAVRERAAARLPDGLRSWHTRIVYGTLQAHYGNPRIHYEVWLVRKTGRIEVGLHFEDERDRNLRLALELARHADALRAGIGADIELEQWTASWTRLHQTLPLGGLDEALCDAVAGRLAALVSVTQPLLAAMGAHRPLRATFHPRPAPRRRGARARRP